MISATAGFITANLVPSLIVVFLVGGVVGYVICRWKGKKKVKEVVESTTAPE